LIVASETFYFFAAVAVTICCAVQFSNNKYIVSSAACSCCHLDLIWALLENSPFAFSIAVAARCATTDAACCQHHSCCISISPGSPCLNFLLFLCQPSLIADALAVTIALQLPLLSVAIAKAVTIAIVTSSQ